MLQKGFLKPEISIDKIGKTNFWLGIIVGIAMSIVLTYAFNYSRESMRIFTVSQMRDLFILPEKEFRTYDLFFATLSTSLGFGFTVLFWLKSRSIKIKKNYFKVLAISNLWLTIFIILMVITRFGTVIFLSVYGLKGYDGNFNFLSDFWPLLIILPIYGFFSYWNIVRLFFKTNNWIKFSALCCTSLSTILFMSITPNRNILNQNHYLANKERYGFIDAEFENAKKHGVFFDEETKRILRKNYAERTTALVQKLKDAFNQNGTVTLDTLFLEKIVVHNLNLNSTQRFTYSIKKWPYAMPENLYSQIQKHDTSSIETKILFDILKSQLEIFKIPETKEGKQYNNLDYKIDLIPKGTRLHYRVESIYYKLFNTINQIIDNPKYEQYHHLFPDDLPPPPFY